MSTCSNPNLTKPSHPAGIRTQPAAQKVGQWLWLDSLQPHGRTRSITVEQLSCSCQQAPSETTGSEVQGLTAQQRWQMAFVSGALGSSWPTGRVSERREQGVRREWEAGWGEPWVSAPFLLGPAMRCSLGEGMGYSFCLPLFPDDSS